MKKPDTLISTQTFLGFFLITLGLILGSCQREPQEARQSLPLNSGNNGPQEIYAKVIVKPLKKSTAAGYLNFEQNKEQKSVKITGRFTGLEPKSKQAIHIHKYGDCSADDGSNAGGHFNPGDHSHGSPSEPQQHAGDLGNIKVDKDGNAEFSLVNKDIALLTPPGKSVLGRSVIIHAEKDDFTTQPAGDAGERIACGIIGIVNADAIVRPNKKQARN